MLNEKMIELGENSSEIRELFEYGCKRKAEIGADKVFDFSLGNPNVPCPPEVRDNFYRVLGEMDDVELHGYTSAPGDFKVRKAISDYMNETYSIGCEPTDFYMTAGILNHCPAICMQGWQSGGSVYAILSGIQGIHRKCGWGDCRGSGENRRFSAGL